MKMTESKDIADEIIELDPKEELRELSKKIDDVSGFYKSLRKKADKMLYKNILDRLRKETRNKLTETEYANLARMMFWCDRFEALFAETPSDQIDVDLFNTYRTTLNQVTEALRLFREKTTAPPSSIGEIKNYIINIQTKNKKLFRDDFEDEIIDIDDTEGT